MSKNLREEFKNVNQPINIFCFDPGFTTGFAHLTLTDDTLEPQNLDPLDLGNHYGISVLGRYQEFLDELLCDVDSEHSIVVIEDFTGGTGGNVQNTVNQYIGVLASTALCHLDTRYVVKQPSSKRRPFLKYARKFTPRKTSRHSIDAVSHGISIASHIRGLENLYWQSYKLEPKLDVADVAGS